MVPGSNEQDRILSISAAAIWGLGAAYRLIRVAFFSSRAVVKSAQRTGDVVQVKLRTLKPVSIAPGSYFHVFLPVSRFSKDHLQLTKYNFLQSYPLAAYWDSKEDISGRSDPVLLIHTGKLPRFEQIKENQTLLLDGPYQQGLAIENYDIVILTAEGRGILRILPIMINLMARRLSDKKGPDKSLFRDRTRRVDLFWWLGDNAEDKWVREQLRSLKSLDPEHVSIFSSEVLTSETNLIRNSSSSGCFIPSLKVTRVNHFFPSLTILRILRKKNIGYVPTTVLV